MLQIYKFKGGEDRGRDTDSNKVINDRMIEEVLKMMLDMMLEIMGCSDTDVG